MPKNFMVPDLTKLQPLTGANYCRWSEELLFFFREIGLDYVLMEDKSSESSKSKPEGSFQEHNRKCRGHIIGHLSEKFFEIYGNYESVKEIWFPLKKKYGGKDKANNQDVTTKWALFQINDQLHEYEAIVSKIQAEGIPMDDHLAALVLLNNLPQSWNEYLCLF